MGNFYDEVRELKGRESRKVANNTYLVRLSDDCIALKLHNTYVILWHDDGRIVLNSNGWTTATTKDRIDRWLPGGLRLASDTDGCWAVYRLRAKRPNGYEFVGYGFDGRRYFDGMVIDEMGTVLNPEDRTTYDVRTESGW